MLAGVSHVVPFQVQEGYGQTECTAAATFQRVHDNEAGLTLSRPRFARVGCECGGDSVVLMISIVNNYSPKWR